MTMKPFSSFPFSETEEEKRMTLLYTESIETEKKMTPKEYKQPVEEEKAISFHQTLLDALFATSEFEVFNAEEMSSIHRFLLSDIPICSLFERAEGSAEIPFSFSELRYCWGLISRKLENFDTTRSKLVDCKKKQDIILNRTKEAQEIIEELKEMDFF